MLKELSSANEFNSTVANGVHVVDFYANWCAPCMAMSPFLHELASTNPSFSILKVDIDNHYELAKAHNVRAVPTIMFFKDGKLKDTVVGSLSKADILAKIATL